MLLSAHQDAFHKLSEAAKRLQAELLNEGAFQVQIFSTLSMRCDWSDLTRLGSALAMLPRGVFLRGSVGSLEAPIGLQDICDGCLVDCLQSGPAAVDCMF